jgi:DNA repair protein RAD51
MPVDSLTTKGVSAVDIKKLVEGGLNTIEAVLFQPKKALLLIKGLSEMKVDKIVTACNELISMGF